MSESKPGPIDSVRGSGKPGGVGKPRVDGKREDTSNFTNYIILMIVKTINWLRNTDLSWSVKSQSTRTVHILKKSSNLCFFVVLQGEIV